MSTDDLIIAEVAAAFATVERPEHFTNYLHCEECAEYDALFCAHDRDTLEVGHVDAEAWEPLIYSSVQGKAYYMPSLITFALEGTTNNSPYLMRLLVHLEGDGANNALIRYCSNEQRTAVAVFLEHVIETRASALDEGAAADQLLRTHGHWSAQT